MNKVFGYIKFSISINIINKNYVYIICYFLVVNMFCNYKTFIKIILI